MTSKTIIMESKLQCRQKGMDPGRPPVFYERFTQQELDAELFKYKETLDIVHFFMEKFLANVSGIPIIVAITDHQGYILQFQGDPSILDTVNELGIRAGVRFTDDMGPSSIALSLRLGKPVQLLGDDHYHDALQELACYSAPFFDKESQRMLGSISLMAHIDYAHNNLLLALLCSVVDSIERELLLRRSNTQLHILNQALLETNHYGVIVADAAGTVMNMNASSLQMLQSQEGLANVVPGFHVQELAAVGRYFEQVMESLKPCIGVELTVGSPDEIRNLMLDVVPIYGSNRSLIRVVGSLRDITEMKKTEELLRNTEKLVFAGQLAVGIAHEIRNPLTTVKGLLQLSGEGGKVSHYMLMMSELERMNLIVSEFLFLGKPQAVQFKEEQCLTILQEVLSIFEIQASMNGIAVTSEFIHNLLIRCDRNQIKQVFLNILKNAMDALPFGGKIAIKLDRSEACQRIRITDNGGGMTEEMLRNLGQPFYTTKPDGNGLGIRIVKNILASHKGYMEITSHIGAGTTVDIFLPSM